MDLLKALTAQTPWISDAEKELADTCMEGLREDLRQHGLPMTMTAALRIHAIVRFVLLASRAEQALDPQGFAPGLAGVAKNAAGAICCIGRAQDQLRKACKDFDDYCRRESAAQAKAAKQPHETATAAPSAPSNITPLKPAAAPVARQSSIQASPKPGAHQAAPKAPAHTGADRPKYRVLPNSGASGGAYLPLSAQPK